MHDAAGSQVGKFNAKAFDELVDDLDVPERAPLTSAEAAVLRRRIAGFSPWHVIAVQGLVGVLVASGVWFIFNQPTWAWSAAYGALAVVLPAMLFARGLARQRNAPAPAAALAGMFVWEMVKILLTIAMLFAAPRVVTDMNWLALLAGFVVTMKASWLAMLWQHRRKSSIAESF